LFYEGVPFYKWELSQSEIPIHDHKIKKLNRIKKMVMRNNH